MKVLREVQAELDKKIMCACGIGDCWHGIEVFPNSLVFYPDASDEQAGSFVFELPQGMRLAQEVEVEPEFTEESGIELGMTPEDAKILASVQSTLQQIYELEIEYSYRKADYYQKENSENYEKWRSLAPSARVLRTLRELAKDDPEIAEWMEKWK